MLSRILISFIVVGLAAGKNFILLRLIILLVQYREIKVFNTYFKLKLQNMTPFLRIKISSNISSEGI